MIKLFLMHHSKLKKLKYERHAEALFAADCMGSVPDLRFQVKWHCDSDFIPFLSKLAPHDTIQIYKSGQRNIARIDFNQSANSATVDGGGKGPGGRRPMSLLFKDKLIQLVDHKNKTVSTDLYELLALNQTQENDHFDGQAFELANSNTLSEKQIIKLIQEEIVSQDQKTKRKKCKVSLQ
jgi:hypothetical protein